MNEHNGLTIYKGPSFIKDLTFLSPLHISTSPPIIAYTSTSTPLSAFSCPIPSYTSIINPLNSYITSMLNLSNPSIYTSPYYALSRISRYNLIPSSFSSSPPDTTSLSYCIIITRASLSLLPSTLSSTFLSSSWPSGFFFPSSVALSPPYPFSRSLSFSISAFETTHPILAGSLSAAFDLIGGVLIAYGSCVSIILVSSVVGMNG